MHLAGRSICALAISARVFARSSHTCTFLSRKRAEKSLEPQLHAAGSAPAIIGRSVELSLRVVWAPVWARLARRSDGQASGRMVTEATNGSAMQKAACSWSRRVQTDRQDVQTAHFSAPVISFSCLRPASAEKRGEYMRARHARDPFGRHVTSGGAQVALPIRFGPLWPRRAAGRLGSCVRGVQNRLGRPSVPHGAAFRENRQKKRASEEALGNLVGDTRFELVTPSV